MTIRDAATASAHPRPTYTAGPISRRPRSDIQASIGARYSRMAAFAVCPDGKDLNSSEDIPCPSASALSADPKIHQGLKLYSLWTSSMRMRGRDHPILM